MYRPGARVGGDGGVSGHAHGLAIDAARFTLRDGVAIDVLDDWEGRKLGQDPCPVRSDEGSASRLLRKITCSAADSRLFQVVLTPHYNKAHGNHVHLEIKPDGRLDICPVSPATSRAKRPGQHTLGGALTGRRE